MNWSLRVCRVAGIPIFIHWTFLVFLAGLTFVNLSKGESISEAGLTLALMIALFTCVLLHELGHALAARRYGIKTDSITLLPIGGVARLERMPTDPIEEIVVALAGPAVNVVIAAILFAGLTIWSVATSFEAPFDDEKLSLSLSLVQVVRTLLYLNVVLVIFNLIPAFPMDGGRVLRAILAKWLDYARATQIAARVGQGIAILMAFFGLVSGHPMLFLVALFVFLGAQAEAGSVQANSLLGGVRVRDAMQSRFRALNEGDALQVAVRELLVDSQRDFPVLRGASVVGLLTRERLIHALAATGPATLIGAAMDREFTPVDDIAPLEEVYRTMAGSGHAMLPVLRAGQLVGILTTENISEFMMVRSALQSSSHSYGAAPAKVVAM